MALTLTVQRGKTFVLDPEEKLTLTKLNELGLPTVTISGTVENSDIADSTIEKAKLVETLRDLLTKLDKIDDKFDANGEFQDGTVPAKSLTPGVIYFGTDTGSENAYAVTFAPAVGSYKTGLMVAFKAASRNTGSASLNANGVGAKPIYKRPGKKVQTGDIRKDQMVVVRYDEGLDSSKGGWQMVSQVGHPAASLGSARQILRMNSDGSEQEWVDQSSGIQVQKLDPEFWVAVSGGTVSGTKSPSWDSASDLSDVEMLTSGVLTGTKGEGHFRAKFDVSLSDLKSAGADFDSWGDISGFVVYMEAFTKGGSDDYYAGVLFWNPTADKYVASAWSFDNAGTQGNASMCYVPRLQSDKLSVLLLSEQQVNEGVGMKIVGVY